MAPTSSSRVEGAIWLYLPMVFPGQMPIEVQWAKRITVAYDRHYSVTRELKRWRLSDECKKVAL